MVGILKNKTRLELYYEIEEIMEENKKKFNYPRISGKSIDVGFAEFFSFLEIIMVTF
jgi:hypothetical protein